MVAFASEHAEACPYNTAEIIVGTPNLWFELLASEAYTFNPHL